MTVALNHRTVLDAIPQDGATESQIAATLGAPVPGVHGLLTSLVCGDLVSMRPTGQG